jgi:tetrahydromethanopterin S-methyltransferase subunit G
MMNIQLWSAVAVIVPGYVVGFYFQHRDIEAANRRIDDLYKRIDGGLAAVNQRIDDLRNEINHRFEDLLRYIDQRFKNLEERLERLEHPITRP